MLRGRCSWSSELLGFYSQSALSRVSLFSIGPSLNLKFLIVYSLWALFPSQFINCHLPNFELQISISIWLISPLWCLRGTKPWCPNLALSCTSWKTWNNSLSALSPFPVFPQVLSILLLKCLPIKSTSQPSQPSLPSPSYSLTHLPFSPLTSIPFCMCRFTHKHMHPNPTSTLHFTARIFFVSINQT